jgi:hypothetical protein
MPNLKIYLQFSLASLDKFWDNTSKQVSKASCSPIKMHCVLIIFLLLSFVQVLILRSYVELNDDLPRLTSDFSRDINNIWEILELLGLLGL